MKLFKHQQKAIEFFKEIPRGLDLSDPGTGKTRVQLDLFEDKVRRYGGRGLVLAPKSLLESAWCEDAAKFNPGLKVVAAYAHNRDKVFREEVDLYVTNTDGVRWLAKQKPSFFRDYHTLIIDELSCYKHRTSLRSRCLRKIVKHFKYRYGLTGTPNTNSVLDLWHQAMVIDDGQRLGRFYSQFRASVATPVQVGPQPTMVKWEDKPGAYNAVADLLSDISVRYKLEECLDIPKNNLYTIPYTLTPTQRAVYDHMEQHAIYEVNNETVSAVNAAALMTKLLQIASGTVYNESNTSTNIEDDRYRLVVDLVSVRPCSLVFYNWRHQADILETLLKQQGITYCKIDGSTQNRSEIVKDFQAGCYQVCLAQPQAAAHGLTLTRAKTAIWVSPTHNLEYFLQGNRRIYRAGQDRKTETILVCAKGTIEEAVYERLQTKDMAQLTFLEVLQALRT